MRALEETLRRIFPLDSAEEETWRLRLAASAQAEGEPAFDAARLAGRLAGIGRGPLHPHKPLLAIFTAAHGIAMKRLLAAVAPTPAMPITAATIPAMPVFVIDMGGGDNFDQTAVNSMAAVKPLSRPTAPYCADISRGPAMSIAIARQAVESGIGLLEEWRQYDLFAIACQGRGVLYAASAIAIRCLGEYQAADLPVGIEAALLSEIISVACDGKTGLELLAAFGGFDLAGAAGLMLALAANRQPIVLADFPAVSAALLAVRLEPFIRDYLFAVPAAVSAQCPLHQAALTLLGAPPLDPGQNLERSLSALIAASSLFIEAGRA